MSIDWEQRFRSWSKPSSETEATKIENAVSMVRNAVNYDEILSEYNIDVFVQGSYKNNTNVKQDSDVDICVCCTDLIDSDYELAPNLNDSLVGLVPATYSYARFKNDLQSALENYFGASVVKRGDKNFDVHANSYRVDADVVPAIVLRLYSENGTYRQGTRIISDSGIRINNYPKQHYDNGVKKNNVTSNRFKFITRALKRLRNEMVGENYASARSIPSFLVECCAYLTPNEYFVGDSYKRNVKDCIGYVWEQIDNVSLCRKLTEINEIKFLFHNRQKWSAQQVRDFLCDAWNYIKSN